MSLLTIMMAFVSIWVSGLVASTIMIKQNHPIFGSFIAVLTLLVLSAFKVNF